MNKVKITTIGQLREAIRDLEHQNYVNDQQMRARITAVVDRLKPANVVRHLISNLFFDGREAKMGLLRMVAGIATSLIVKKLFHKRLRR